MKNKSQCPCFGEQAVNYNPLPFGTFTGGRENNGPLSASIYGTFLELSAVQSVLLNVKTRLGAGSLCNLWEKPQLSQVNFEIALSLILFF